MKKEVGQLARKIQKCTISTEEIIVIAAGIQKELEYYIDPVKREYLPKFL